MAAAPRFGAGRLVQTGGDVSTSLVMHNYIFNMSSDEKQLCVSVPDSIYDNPSTPVLSRSLSWFLEDGTLKTL